MRALAVLCLVSGAGLVATLPGVARADVVELPFPVVAAEVFPEGARVTARAAVALPAGDHEIVLLVPPAYLRDGFRAEVEGAVLTGTRVEQNTAFAPDVFDAPAQAAAREAVRVAEASLGAAEVALAAQIARIEALGAAEGLLRSIGGGAALPSLVELSQMVDLVSAELLDIAEAKAALERELPPLVTSVDRAEAALTRAEARLALLGAPQAAGWSLARLDVQLADAGDVTVTREFTDVGAGWSVSYDAALDTGVRLERVVDIRHGAGVPWIDAEVTLSTAMPSGQMEARTVTRDVARIGDRAPAPVMRSTALDTAGAPEMLMEAAPAFAVAETDGPVVSYRLPAPVTVLLEGQVSVALAPLELDADRYLAATPRFDGTAFHMADIRNLSGEPILPGPVRLSRDGAFVGQGFLPAIAAGAEATLGFGPEPDIALSVRFIDQQEGDRGIIRGRAVRQDEIRLSAENLGDAAREVRLRYAVPTSQQEDLEIDVDLSPSPSEVDVEDQRGVMEWQLALAPGETAEIALSFDLSWPEGQALFWAP
ncbi:MAG: DUF4139 domain-containing protein [Pseudomonadota bacterium]